MIQNCYCKYRCCWNNQQKAANCLWRWGRPQWRRQGSMGCGSKLHCILTWSQFSEQSPVFALGGEKLQRAPWCWSGVWNGGEGWGCLYQWRMAGLHCQQLEQVSVNLRILSAPDDRPLSSSWLLLWASPARVTAAGQWRSSPLPSKSGSSLRWNPRGVSV